MEFPLFSGRLACYWEARPGPRSRKLKLLVGFRQTYQLRVSCPRHPYCPPSAIIERGESDALRSGDKKIVIQKCLLVERNENRCQERNRACKSRRSTRGVFEDKGERASSCDDDRKRRNFP